MVCVEVHFQKSTQSKLIVCDFSRWATSPELRIQVSTCAEGLVGTHHDLIHKAEGEDRDELKITNRNGSIVSSMVLKGAVQKLLIKHN